MTRGGAYGPGTASPSPPSETTRQPGGGALGLGSPGRRIVVVALASLLLGAVPFFVATTFIGDDHLFLAFARYEPRPWRVLVADAHGGEFYRPIPMLLWWLLARLGRPPQAWPFAGLALLLHVSVAVELGGVLWVVRSSRGLAQGGWRVPALAAACFFLAPLPREAAYWYAASTDLLAAAFGLGAVLAVSRGAGAVGALALALACGSKETAVAFALLAVIVLHAQGLAGRTILRRIALFVPVLVVYGVARTLVLHGAGGSGDEGASVRDKAIQIVAGLIHLLPGDEALPEPLGSALGILAWALVALARRIRARRPALDADRTWILMWLCVSLVPLFAARWIVGARYFYVPAMAACLLVAEALSRFSSRVTLAVLIGLAGLSSADVIRRHRDVVEYDVRVSAVREAIAAEVAGGARIFHVQAGIKDLDLAVKEAPALRAVEPELLILGDVPASFVVAPDPRHIELAFLLAAPPLPPSGAYHFGDRRVVGLARRGDDPPLDEVLARLPAIRFLRPSAAGVGRRLVYRDVTDAIRAANPAP